MSYSNLSLFIVHSTCIFVPIGIMYMLGGGVVIGWSSNIRANK